MSEEREKVDKEITCRDCGEVFTFTVGEQEFYERKGFNNFPLSCSSCRKARKNAKISGERQIYTATCADCKGVASVPFKPKEDQEVFCSECFKVRER